MIEGVFNCGGLIYLDEHAHPRDAHNASSCRHFLDGFVGLAARVRNEGAAVGVCNQYRLLGNLKRIQRRMISTMRDINGHAQLIHPPDDRDSKITDAIVAALRGTVANQVACVVGELRNTLPKTEEEIDIVRSAKVF